MKSTVISLILFCFCGSAAAKTSDLLDPTNPILGFLREGMTPGDYVERVLQPFAKTVQADGSITLEVETRADLSLHASMRANAIASVLRSDLNGDLKVSGDEIQYGSMRRYDQNQDGVIELPEIVADQKERFNIDSQQLQTIRALLALGVGRDGKISRTQFMTFAEETFKAADKNRDGRISDEEKFLLPGAASLFIAR